MHSFFSGTSTQKLYGVLHPQPYASHAVLICGSLGQEAQASHRFLNVLASRLAANGVAAMRFDYFGCGDSYGSSLELDLEGMILSTTLALEELRENYPHAQLSLIGYRIGAVPALIQSENASCRTLLIDPILDSQIWLKELGNQHDCMLTTTEDYCEIGSFCISPAFSEELQQGIFSWGSIDKQSIAVIVSSSEPLAKFSEEQLVDIVESEASWIISGEGELAFIPAKLIDKVVSRVSEND